MSRRSNKVISKRNSHDDSSQESDDEPMWDVDKVRKRRYMNYLI